MPGAIIKIFMSVQSELVYWDVQNVSKPVFFIFCKLFPKTEEVYIKCPTRVYEMFCKAECVYNVCIIL